MKQSIVQVQRFIVRFDYIESPEYFCQEELGLHPGHLSAKANPWAEAEGVKTFEMVFSEDILI
jgi:hypothetical protein